MLLAHFKIQNTKQKNKNEITLNIYDYIWSQLLDLVRTYFENNL